MKRFLLLFTTAALAFAADNSWQKVQELKSGTELRIIRKGVAKPILATLDEAHDDSLVIATKKEQLAIPKDEIERIDARPRGGSRVSKETKTTETPPDTTTPSPHGQIAPTTSSSTNVSFGGKPDFETVYRRTASAQ